MISRIKDGKVFDVIIFNQQEEKGENPSTDVLSSKQGTAKVQIFGLQQKQIRVYQYHKYYTDYYLSKTIGRELIKQFISGYYGITEEFIIKYTENEFDPLDQRDVKITFEIQQDYQEITMTERQGKLGGYKQITDQIKLYSPFFKIFKLRQKSHIEYFKNLIDEKQYIDIFNQLYIGMYYMKLREYINLNIENTNDQEQLDQLIFFYVSCVKYNNNYKGKIFFPMKLYHDLPILEDNSLLIQLLDNNQIVTYIFKQNMLIVHQQLIISHIVPNPFRFKQGGKTKTIKQYQIQLNFVNQTQKQITKKMDLLNFMQWKKTHGNQFLITGIKYNTQIQPKLKITFFPSTQYVQIQCETDELNTALLNFTMLVNYFKLEDPLHEIYDEKNESVKKEFVKEYIEQKEQQENLLVIQGDYTGIGTSKFNIKQHFQKIQDSQLDDLQQIDPISFGMDDRYEYQKLVTDVQKRPIQIPFEVNTVDVFQYFRNQEKSKESKENEENQKTNKENENQEKSKESKENEENQKTNQENENQEKSQEEEEKGGAKGSPVYVNIDHDYTEFLLYQHDFIVNGFLLRNQTFAGIQNRYKCSDSYPYLLLGNTKGKDSISCVLEPINPVGLSVFEFYDVGTRLFVDDKILKYLRKFLYGRVSISATKFSQWIIPGRCSEVPLDLKKLLGSNTLLLSVLNIQNRLVSDIQYEINPIIDLDWIESVFGKKYNEMYDGDVIYDYQDQQYYSTNPKGKNQSFWVKFNNHKKYLVIIDNIITQNVNGKKQHFYQPYYNQFQLTKQPRKYDLQYYKKFDIQGYVEYSPHNYLITKQGAFPLVDSCFGLPLLDVQIQNKLPDYETVKKMIDDTDNYIINYKGNKIGTKYDGLFFYWKETNFDTQQKLTIGTYISKIDYQIHLEQTGTRYDFQTIAYCIYTFIQLYKYKQQQKIKLDSKEKSDMVMEILNDKQKLIDVIKYLNRLQETHDDIFYLNKNILLLSSIREDDIDLAVEQLKQLLPGTGQMMYDRIKGLATFSNEKDLVYNPRQKEEILRLKIKKDLDFDD